MRVQEWLRRSSLIATALFLVILNVKDAEGIGNLRVAYQWKVLEYAWPDEETRQNFSHYVPDNNNPLGVEVAGDRLFITVPRWKSGVAATLNYINLNDTSESPLLNPYPSWDAHRLGNDSVPDVVSVFRIWADGCDRLWVLDMGYENYTGSSVLLAAPSLIVYNLTTDQVIRKYVIPSDYYPARSHFGNVVVEEGASCDESFAYLAELQGPGIIVYSWATNDSWLVKHHFLHPDPLAGIFNVSGLSFHWWDGVVSLALAPEADGFSTLYFHPLCSTTEFSVSTRVLRDSKNVFSKSTFYKFNVLGSRGHNGQGASSYIDPETGILFHAQSIGDAVTCWKPGKEYNRQNIGFVYVDIANSIFPVDIKIDRQSNIWVMADRLPIFMYGQWNPNIYNYRVLTGSVQEAVAGTPCSSEL